MFIATITASNPPVHILPLEAICLHYYLVKVWKTSKPLVKSTSADIHHREQASLTVLPSLIYISSFALAVELYFDTLILLLYH